MILYSTWPQKTGQNFLRIEQRMMFQTQHQQETLMKTTYSVKCDKIGSACQQFHAVTRNWTS